MNKLIEKAIGKMMAVSTSYRFPKEGKYLGREGSVRSMLRKVGISLVRINWEAGL